MKENENGPTEMLLRPIGVIRNGHREKPEEPWEGIESEIVVHEELTEALDGIEDFSHVHVVFWLHRAEGERGSYLKLHPERREDIPMVGVFATRTMFRPNPVGVTAVRLLSRRGNVLRVLGLDALDGTPLLDLKPYLARGDAWPGATGPDWLKKLWAEE